MVDPTEHLPPFVVPGQLQTAGYARQVLAWSEARYGSKVTNTDHAVVNRLAAGQFLYDPTKQRAAAGRRGRRPPGIHHGSRLGPRSPDPGHRWYRRFVPALGHRHRDQPGTETEIDTHPTPIDAVDLGDWVLDVARSSPEPGPRWPSIDLMQPVCPNELLVNYFNRLLERGGQFSYRFAAA